MRWHAVEGHAEVLAGLWRAARERRLAHALCFSGPEGVGKFLAAERLAFGLVCAQGPGEPCGHCGPEKRLKIGSHPDVFVVDPVAEELESISIGHVTPRAGGPRTTIAQFLALRPMEGGWRIVLVRESDRLVEEAQNALLKTLEEPGDTTLLVLETARPDRLLPTIHSRCVRVPLGALGREAVARVLAGHDLPRAEAETLARLADGAPGRALLLARANVVEMLAIVERALLDAGEPLALTAEWHAHEGSFAGKTPTREARTKARIFLDLLASVLRDAARIRAGRAAADLPFGTLAARVAALPEALAAHALEGTLLARQDVDQNLAPDAAVERALLACEPLSKRASLPSRC